MTQIKGKIGIPSSYFLKMAKADYSYYIRALPREFYQNSIDAGAKRIDVKFDSRERTIRVIDDGCGMTRDILLNKLLVLGGSHKAEHSVGAFGKAKEILYFSWESYAIRTNNLLVRGAGAEYTLSEVAAEVRGTDCTIKIQKNFDDNEWITFDRLREEFKYVASRMEVDCEIYVDGELCECEVLRGTMVNDLGWAKLYYSERKNFSGNYIDFRINGIWMFYSYLSNAGKIGQLIVELSKDSITCLTSNRDDLKGEWKTEAHKMLQQLIVDKYQLLYPTPDIVREHISGSGSVEVIGAALKSRLNVCKTREDIKNAIMDVSSKYQSESVFGDRPLIVKERIATTLEDLITPETSIYDYQDRLAFIGYEPDFNIRRAGDQQRQVDLFMKTKRAVIFAKMWTEVVKQVMLDNELYINFTAGFIFDGKVEALYEQIKNEHFIYLNPNLIGSLCGIKPRLTHRKFVIQDMLEKAIHEVTHMKGERNHDEDFSSAMSVTRGATFRSSKIYRALEKIQ